MHQKRMTCGSQESLNTIKSLAQHRPYVYVDGHEGNFYLASKVMFDMLSSLLFGHISTYIKSINNDNDNV